MQVDDIIKIGGYPKPGMRIQEVVSFSFHSLISFISQPCPNWQVSTLLNTTTLRPFHVFTSIQSSLPLR